MTTRWEHEGRFFITQGLLQIADMPRLQADEDHWSDPPKFRPEVVTWLAEHPEVNYVATPMIGPPWWDFPSAELLEEFSELFFETEEQQLVEREARVKRWHQRMHDKWVEQGSRLDQKGRWIMTFEDGVTHALDSRQFKGQLAELLADLSKEDEVTDDG